MGELSNWKMDAHLVAAKELVRSDDVLLALDLLTTHMPAYYRQFPPKEILDLRNEITKRIAGPGFYSREEDKCDFSGYASAGELLRGKLLYEEVAALNSQNKTPHIIDAGPGAFWCPQFLLEKSCSFTYKPIVINPKSEIEFFNKFPQVKRDQIAGEPTIFLALELIEHMPQERDIKGMMLTACGLADYVHISTPAYSFATWEREMADVLGHLRTYTPQEMFDLITSIFPEYTSQFFFSDVMSMRLVRKDG